MQAVPSLHRSCLYFGCVISCAALSLMAAASVPLHAHAASSPGAVEVAASFAPDTIAPSVPTTVGGSVVAPAFDGVGSTGILASEGSLTDSRISTNPAAGFEFGTGWGYLSVIPVDISVAAETATVVNRAAAVFAGTAPGADTIIRPSALGVSTYTHIRSHAAPETYSWRLSLPGGQVLRRMDNGSVAITASAAPVAASAPTAASAFDVAVAALGAPQRATEAATVAPQTGSANDTGSHAATTQTPQEKTVPDAKAQARSGAETLARAASQTDGHLVAAIQKPWAVDANGKQVPASLSVNGDVVTMTIDYRRGDYALPIIADPDLIDCADVSPCGTYYGARAAAYASRWRVAHNPAYKSFDADCTNFMSQILRAGGLAMMREYETGEGSWWMAKNGPFFAPWNWTHSWSVADTLQQHLREYGLARVTNGAWRQGDFIAYDWDPDGQYDHINFVYTVRDGEPYLLQHTPEYAVPRSFSSFKRRARQQFGYFTVIHLRPVRAFANIT